MGPTAVLYFFLFKTLGLLRCRESVTLMESPRLT